MNEILLQNLRDYDSFFWTLCGLGNIFYLKILTDFRYPSTILSDNQYRSCDCHACVFRLDKMVAYTLSVSTRRLFACHSRLSSCLNTVTNKRYNSYTSHLDGETVRVGCASGFWGDTAVSGVFSVCLHLPWPIKVLKVLMRVHVSLGLCSQG